MGWKEAIYTYPSSIVYEIHEKIMSVFGKNAALRKFSQEKIN
jgi:hypothetical protein